MPDRRVAIVLLVVAALVIAGAVAWLMRSPGAPTSPVAVEVLAETCESPCDEILPSVTVRWTPPESGASPTGYRVLRDGAPLGEDLDPYSRSVVDEVVTIGESHSYQVIALSEEGDSPPTDPIEATVPLPPDTTAHLHGVYGVRLTVRSARSIGAAFGIEDPQPGNRGRDRWSFESTCSETEGACPSTWSGLEGTIMAQGSRWRGTVDGLPARCGPSRRAPAPIDVDLEAADVGVVGSAWVVTRFRGTARVSFRCPGFPPASATVSVIGRV
jgi:hypothetical protein